MKRSKVIGSIFTAAALALTLAGCGGSADAQGEEGQDGSPKEGGVIKVGSYVPRAAPEPVTLHDPGSNIVVQQVMEYLLFVENDGSITPVLATDYSSPDDGLTWEFELRSGVKFHDGTEFSAADVEATIERIIAEDSVSAAKSSFDGVLSPGNIEVVDDTHIVFHLDVAFADFPLLVSSGNYPTVITKADYAGDFLENPVGTGPFIMTDYQSGVKASYEKFEDYWNADEVHIDGIDLQFFADSSAYTSAMLSGSIDIIPQVSYAQNGPLFEADTVELQSATLSLGQLLQMRADQGPFADTKVRQAMAYAVDREALSYALYGPLGTPGNDTIWTDQFPEKVEIEQRTRDLEKSKQLLAEAGHPDGLEVTLTVPSEQSRFGELVQSQANEGGFKVELEVMDTNVYYQDAWLNVDFGMTGWAARPSASQILSMLYVSDGSWNTAHWSNAEFDGLAEELTHTVDPEARTEIAQRLDEIVHEEVPQVIPAMGMAIQGYNDYVKGYKVSQFFYLNFVGVWLDK